MMKNDDMCDNTFDDTYDDFHCASYIFNHANDTFDDGRDDKKIFFFPVPGPLEGRKHLLLCGDDEQQPRGQATVGVQL